jgi:ribonuclease P protein component
VAATSGRFRKEDRQRDGRDFRRISRKGDRYRTQHFIVLAKAATDDLPIPRPRIGLTVSRKVGNAVVRNRMKWLLREWFRCHRSEIPSSIELVVIVRPQGANLAYDQIRRELGEVIRKFGGAAGGD